MAATCPLEVSSQLAAALVNKPTVGTITKAEKQTRYGVGTIATVKHTARLIFFLAYCEMDAHNTARSTPDKVWTSLLLLWDEVSKKQTVVRCPYRSSAAAKRDFQASSPRRTRSASRDYPLCLRRAPRRFVINFERRQTARLQ
jgi:hypothetical protein